MAAGKTDSSDYLTPERFIIEGYRWLRILHGEGSRRPTRYEVRHEAMRIWAYHQYAYPKQEMSYQAFLHRALTDWRFNEELNVMLANAETIFPVNHIERLFSKLGLDDLEAKRGRPNKNRKGAAKRQTALVKEKKLAKK